MRHLTITLSLALGLIAPLVPAATLAAQPLDHAAVSTACPSTSTLDTAAEAVAVTIDNSHITISAQRLEQGCTTLVIRNASRLRSSLIVARGTTASLRYLPFPVPYVPVETVVRRVELSSGGHARLTLLLARGRYLLAASTPQTTIVRSATPFHVR